MDVFDAVGDVYLYSIPGFCGNDGSAGGADPTTGPNGILVLHKGKAPNESSELWAGDGSSTVKVFDLTVTPPKMIANIATGYMSWGKAKSGNRAGTAAYHVKDGIIMIANDFLGGHVCGRPGIICDLHIPEDQGKILGTILSR